MKYTIWDKTLNTLYVLSDVMKPRQCNQQDYGQVFRLSYEERINQFASEEAKEEIANALRIHKGCRICTF